MTITIPKDFWDKVETDNLKYVIYGDSVSEDSKTIIKFNNDPIEYLTFLETWNRLLSIGKLPKIINNKEFIFIDDAEFSTVTYAEQMDVLQLRKPKYIMRHLINKEIYKLNLTNDTSLKVTKDHSLLHYNSKSLIKMKPEDSQYLPIIRNNNIDFRNGLSEPLYFIFGLWLSNGTFSNKTKKSENYYPGLSIYSKEETLKLIEKIEPNFEYYEKNNNNDIHIKYKPLRDLLINNNLRGVKSPNRDIPIHILNKFKSDIGSFSSFLLGYFIGDGTYSTKLICFSSASKNLLEQIKEVLMCYGTYSHILIDKNGRNYKGRVKGDMYNLKIIGASRNLLQMFQSVGYLKAIEKIKEYGTFYGKGNSPKNPGIVRNLKKAKLFNIKPIRIQSKELINYNGYVYDFEIPETHNFITNGVLVHNTDSLYLSVPEIECDSAEEYVKESEKVSEEINDLIIGCMNDLVLPKMNVPGHNETFFKTELVMQSILFTNKKKKYCFSEIANEGKIHDKPIIRYTGISVVRTNTASWTKDFIREIVEELALGTKFTDKLEVKAELQRIALKYYTSLQEEIKSLNFTKVGVPCKWGNTVYKRDTAEMIGMKLYNTIADDDYFKPNTSGLKIPIKLTSPNDFMEKIKRFRFTNNNNIGNTSLDKLTFLVVPVYHTKEELEPILTKFGIEIDLDTAWDKLVETTLTNIIECIKENHGLPK